MRALLIFQFLLRPLQIDWFLPRKRGYVQGSCLCVGWALREFYRVCCMLIMSYYIFQWAVFVYKSTDLFDGIHQVVQIWRVSVFELETFPRKNFCIRLIFIIWRFHGKHYACLYQWLVIFRIICFGHWSFLHFCFSPVIKNLMLKAYYVVFLHSGVSILKLPCHKDINIYFLLNN